MKLLLDTHSLLWHYLDDPKLSASARLLLADPTHEVFVSPASHWEIAIKVCTKKLQLLVPFSTLIQEAIYDNHFKILPIEPTHTEVLTTLTLHHKDPFDRLIIAQAIVVGIPILSADPVFDDYTVTRLW